MKYLFLLNLFLINQLIFAQVNIPVSGNKKVTTCAETAYDMGGSSSGISANADGSITFYPAIAGNIIAVMVEELDIDSYNDYLYIYNGTSTSDPLLKTFQGGWGSTNYVDYREYYGNNSSGAVTVRLKTGANATSGDKGCKIRVQCAPTSQVNNMVSNRKRVVTSCNTTIYDHGGLYGDYLANSKDTILILPDSPDKKLQITFKHVALNNIDGYDQLMFLGGLAISSNTTLFGTSGYQLANSGAPLKTVQTDGSISMIMLSDGIKQAQGFRAQISCINETTSAPEEAIVPIAGSATIRTCSTTVYDNGHKYNYYPNSNGTLTILPQIDNKKVSISFTQFNTQTEDIFTVYDGTSTQAAILGTFSGTELPPSLAATTSNTSGALTIKFVSNSSGENTGFVFNTSCSEPLPESLVPATGTASVSRCSNTIFDSGGQTGPYPSNSSGGLLLIPENNGTVMKLKFNSFSTQEDKDILSIYDGSDESAPIIGSFSGSEIPASIEASNPSGKLYLKFISDGSITDQGFSISSSCVVPELKIPVAGNIKITGCSGTFYDGGGSDANYKNGSDGSITITPGVAGSVIKINFLSFSLLPEDTLYVFEGGGYNNLIGKYSGKDIPQSVSAPSSSISGTLTVRLITNSSETSSGFSIEYTCVEKDNYTLVPVTGNTNITTCDMFIYDSGGKDGNYEKYNDGSLTIIPGSPGQVVKLEFISFDVENKYDFVYVYDSIISPATLLGAFSGTTLPSPIVASTSSGVLIVKFESDYAVVKTGFKLYASCVAPMIMMPKNGGKKIASCNINLYDSGGPSGYYSDDENGFITVLPVSPEKKVRLDFDEIDIEEDYEWLYVYDGSDTTSPLIDIYSGTFYPETLKASPDNLSGALTIKFTSDESFVYSGFSAKISCFTPVSSITISEDNISLPIDSSLKLIASVFPEDADDKSITWSTSDPSIVSIDETGKIKGVGYGSAKISAKSNDGYAIAEIDINVHELTSTRKQNVSGKFVVFPNPASDHVKLISHLQNLKVMIYDSAGKVKHRTTVGNEGEIDITSLNEGIYFMEIEGEDFLEFQKLSIVR